MGKSRMLSSAVDKMASVPIAAALIRIDKIQGEFRAAFDRVETETIGVGQKPCPGFGGILGHGQCGIRSRVTIRSSPTPVLHLELINAENWIAKIVPNDRIERIKIPILCILSYSSYVITSEIKIYIPK